MNVFQRIQDVLFADNANDAQGEWAAIHAALQISSDGYSGSDTFTNPAREVLHRWRNVNPHFLAMAKAKLNTLVERFDR